MKLSTKGRYGLRALVDLALQSGPDVVSISSIAQRQGISERYLEQLMAKLKKSGIITSIRGAQGGYVLAKNPEEITIGDILRSLEGDLNPVDCPEVMETGKCSGSGQCAAKMVWKKINDVINQTVNSIKLSDLLEEQRRGGSDPLQTNGKSNQKGEKADGQNDLFGQCCHHGNKA
jgi:Rrf2 family protein